MTSDKRNKICLRECSNFEHLVPSFETFCKDARVHWSAGEGERRQAFINTSCQMVPALENITAVITNTCPFVSSVRGVRALLVKFAKSSCASF